MSDQQALNLASQKAGPVECLGQKFPSEEARREHFLKLLAEKLKDSEFRKIEGFPVGEDEDILALSDPPYYTACPNPWFGDFIKSYGTNIDPKQQYHREPFAADVSEGKNHAVYTAHSYHTKVPHRAIMRYILHYSNPGDVIFDGFCGSGMTGVAAQMCADIKEVQELGYRVDSNGVIYDENGNPFSKLGSRVAILNDLSPAATFIACNYNTPVDVTNFECEAKKILEDVENECGWMFETKHLDGAIGKINYTLWSDVFTCCECAERIVFWEAAVDKKKGAILDAFPCPKCGHELTKRQLQRATETKFDTALNKTVSQAVQAPVLINYSVGTKRYEKRPEKEDLERLDKIASLKIPYWFPTERMMDGGESRRNDPIGLTHVHHFYTKRNLWVLGSLWNKAVKTSQQIKELVFNMQTRANKQSSLHISNYFNGGGGVCKGHLSGTLYIPSLSPEIPATKIYSDRIKTLKRGYEATCRMSRKTVIGTGSTEKVYLPDCSVDFMFLDPPFGANLNYSELNWNDESWLGITTNISSEAVENAAHKKGLNEYRALMINCLRESYRILKPGRWLTVEFSNTQSAVWNSIQSAINEVGFIVANVSVLDKKTGSFKAVNSTTAVKQDLVITAYKPAESLERLFQKNSTSVECVWDFVKTHLTNLPVFKSKGGVLEFVAERDPRILYDRMVAFYVSHNLPVPLSSAEFQSALLEKYSEREGMVFLAEQVTEWDKKRARMESIGQMSIFVDDEKSAIDWLRNYLKERPSTYQDIQPEFMQQLGASWKKFETRPELQILLHQNFLQYDGRGEVPSQIHAYLSTQFKELRNLPKEDKALQSKAKDRWFVPDPAKAIDVESIRNKRLLQEFWDLCDDAGIKRPVAGTQSQQTLPNLALGSSRSAGGKKLKEVRSEAVRLGFKECFAARDYATILAISAKLPENVIEEDEQLQMIHDMAEMRSQS
jgi:16S rRNA G966 N2-methylase RsmD